MMNDVSTEKRVVASILKSRDAFDKIRRHIDESQFSPYGEWAIDQAEAYYNTDPERGSVDVDYLVELAKVRFDNPAKANQYADYVTSCDKVDVSPLNLAQLVLEAKRKALGIELAAAAANDANSQKTRDLIDKFQSLELVDLDDDDDEVYNNVSVKEINKKVNSSEGRIKLAPKSLNDRLKYGGVLPGHHIVIFKRPETGGTAAAITIMRAMCLQGLDGIYFGNEDPIESIIERAQGCLTGLTDEERVAEEEAAEELLRTKGYKHISFVPIHPGTPGQILKHVRRLKPKWVVVDQIRNLNMGSDTRVNTLEAAATFMRNLAKAERLVGISITQAGDSADNKLVLGMGDIDFSNTGIPAQADLMVGIGVNDDFYRAGHVMFSLPKNKIGGNHEHFRCSINKHTSRIETLDD